MQFVLQRSPREWTSSKPLQPRHLAGSFVRKGPTTEPPDDDRLPHLTRSPTMRSSSFTQFAAAWTAVPSAPALSARCSKLVLLLALRFVNTAARRPVAPAARPGSLSLLSLASSSVLKVNKSEALTGTACVTPSGQSSSASHRIEVCVRRTKRLGSGRWAIEMPLWTAQPKPSRTDGGLLKADCLLDRGRRSHTLCLLIKVGAPSLSHLSWQVV